MGANLFDLSGKTALITGGSSGLGLGFAVGLAKGGADVEIWGRDQRKLEAAATKLKSYGTSITTRAVDVSNEQAVIHGMADAIAALGRLDCVIANAGGVTVAPFHEMSAQTYHELIGTAQHGGFYTLREAAKHMVSRAQGGDAGGSLIICGSLSIFAGGAQMAHYGAAKGALNSMSKSMAVELGPYGIRVNVLAIGMTMTEMIEANIENARPFLQQVAERNPTRRVGRTEDLEGIVIYLASDMSKYHNGDTITIDGGHMASIF
jgi:NAD(P)-dependent dehydrogenase (short-subunit alcohol dehydrogenase family)